MVCHRGRPVIRGLLRRWARRLHVRTIAIDGRPYLRRYLVAQAFGCELYLHEFLTADGERHLHDHPWAWSGSLVLAGGYVEQVLRHLDGYAGPCTELRTRAAPAVNLVGRGFHRIHSVFPETWTLFAVGPRRKMWGFLEFIEADGVTIYHQPLDYDRSADPVDWSRFPRGADLEGSHRG
jgi:hypothetical protein